MNEFYFLGIAFVIIPTLFRNLHFYTFHKNNSVKFLVNNKLVAKNVILAPEFWSLPAKIFTDKRARKFPKHGT